MPDAHLQRHNEIRLRLLAEMDRDDEEQREEERREWDARIAVSKALIDGRRIVAVVNDPGYRVSARTRSGWVSLGDGEAFPSTTFFNTLIHAVAKKYARVVEAGA
jgi:hypothetical protein